MGGGDHEKGGCEDGNQLILGARAVGGGTACSRGGGVPMCVN